MEITFPINKLLKNGLTPDEYSICLLLESKKFGLLREFVKLKGNSFYDNIKRLNGLEYITYNTIGNIVEIKDITLTNNFKKLISFEDPFLELYNKFPVKVIRPNGKEDLLRISKNKCKIKYEKILKNNPLIHDHILECLDVEIKDKKSTSSMGYFKRLYNWLENKEWEKYEDKLHTIPNESPHSITKNVAYGHKIV